MRLDLLDRCIIGFTGCYWILEWYGHFIYMSPEVHLALGIILILFSITRG